MMLSSRSLIAIGMVSVVLLFGLGCGLFTPEPEVFENKRVNISAWHEIDGEIGFGPKDFPLNGLKMSGAIVKDKELVQKFFVVTDEFGMGSDLVGIQVADGKYQVITKFPDMFIGLCLAGLSDSWSMPRPGLEDSVINFSAWYEDCPENAYSAWSF